jgi:hypothetical protein
MCGSIYLGIGTIIGFLVFTIGFICPAVYYSFLWSKNFINDYVPKKGEENPLDKAREYFTPPGSYFQKTEPYFSFYIYLIIACATTLLWPLAFLAACGYGILCFLRLSSRLKRHIDTINAHSAKKKKTNK